MNQYDRILDEILIDLVSKRPIIYSSSHPQHRNYIEKHRAWEEISIILNTPIPGLKQRWKHFRDHYHKKKKQTHKKIEWKYMHLLGFLSQHPTKDDLSKNKTEKKETKQKLSTGVQYESSDFSTASEFESEGSESASSVGSFSYKRAEMLLPEIPNTVKHIDSPEKEANNQIDNIHAQSTEGKQEISRENFSKMLKEKIKQSFTRHRANLSSSNHKSPESPTGETSLGIRTNLNNPEIRGNTTIEQTSVPGVFEANSEPSGSRSKAATRTEDIDRDSNILSSYGENFVELDLIESTSRKRSSPLPRTGPVHRFYEAVADIVSMFPPHLVSEAKLTIHKCIYQIEKECLGLMEDDDDDDL